MTTNEAAAYLDELGLSLPQPLLAAIIAQIDTINGCLAEYPDATQNLIRYYLLGILGINFGGRRIASQSGPNGASRSFAYGTVEDQQRQLRAALRLIDPNGCTIGLVPVETKPMGALYVVRGGGCK